MRLRRFAVWVGTAMLAVGGVQAQKADAGEAFARAAHLKRGINLSMWYAQPGMTDEAQLDAFIGQRDFQLLHDLGFDHVRISINPALLIAERQSGSLRADRLAQVDKTVSACTALGLVVVLDIHPEEDWKKDVLSSDDGATRLLNFWRNFAHHYATTNPQQVYFELLNEPAGVDVYKWAGLQARLVAVVRAQAPQHTIIATGANYGKIDALVATEPVRDANVIYTFHMYLPFEFTHQGANWMPPGSIYMHGVPYPSSPELVEAARVADPDETARLALARYGAERWDARRVAAEISLGNEWAARRRVPLWCGEFGVFKDYAPAGSRAQWIGDARRAFEASGIGWAMWDYRGSFALVDTSSGAPVADPAVVKALGLR